jgi:signal transduction histidine kinase
MNEQAAGIRPWVPPLIRLGLRARFFLYSNTVIAVTMALVTFFWMLHERQSLNEAIESRGRSIVGAMAIAMTDALHYGSPSYDGETGFIDDYVATMVERDAAFMRYVIVADPDGLVTHASHSKLLGEHFGRAVGPETPGTNQELRIYDDETGERLIEVRSPLAGHGGFFGTLAVGFSMEPVERRVAVVAREAALVALVLILFNSALTALYVETLIRPIFTLNETMKRAGRGDLSVRSLVRRGDEVGELSDAFNRMMDELEAAGEREKIQRAQLAHTEKMVAVGTLAAGVAHEVNNPLAGVLACLDNLRAHPDDAEMRERYLELIRDGLKRIERTVANLLNFSRQREIRPEPTSINHNLRHVVELVGYQLRRRNVEVRFDMDEDDALVMADHFQMEQLFLNLVLNAIDAMPDGGTLTLRTRVRGKKVLAEVSDTGSGIADDVRDRIFDPFFTTREVGEGTGLGLSVSDSIVARHGGSIEFDSKLDEGTSFRVSFTVMQEEPAEGVTE